jgi:hypothetical protein
LGDFEEQNMNLGGDDKVGSGPNGT